MDVEITDIAIQFVLIEKRTARADGVDELWLAF